MTATLGKPTGPLRTRSRAVGRAAALLAAASLSLVAGAARAQAPQPLKLGLLSDMSGFVADVSGLGSLTSARLAIEDYGGTVLGRPIQLLDADHLNKADIGMAIARRWYDEGVPVIFDIGVTPLALGVQNLAREKNRLAIFVGSASPELTGAACSPNGIHWTYNSYAQANGIVRSLVAEKAQSWYFITVDYAYGRGIQRDTTAMVEAGGGRAVGSVLHPFETSDFSSHLLQAQQSKADVIALATSTVHAKTIIKQSDEFGIRAGGQKLAAMSLTLHDVKAIGLKDGQGLLVIAPFYWDQDDASRAFAKRYFARFGKMPNMIQASMYGAITHYLKAVEKAGTDDTAKVAAVMKEMPVNDFMTKNAAIRADGRVMRDMSVFRVKAPAESTGEWDLYTKIATIPASEAFGQADPKVCPLVKG